MLPCGLQSFGGPGSGGIPAPPLPHMFPDSPDGRRPLRRPFGKRHVSKSYIRHISYSESLLREALFLCPGAPLERQPHGPPPPPKTPAALPTEETPRPFTFRRQACRYFAPLGVRFCLFFRWPRPPNPLLPPPHPAAGRPAAEKRGKFRLGRAPDTFCTQSVYLSDEKSTIKSRVENLEF